MLQLVADIRNEDVEKIADAAYANASRLFMPEQPAQE